MNERDLERTMKALANRRRLSILRYLKGRKEANVGDIAEEIRLSFKATSKHLGVLSAADIVDREQRSLQMFYRLAPKPPPGARPVLSLL
ncbi:MAG: winged helix-turn-helix transcriptional regulator [Patescibacteria group bacterium]|nr:winged helix-turn-helix domain-containing protein [Patescibacteria group bacterium]MDE1965731.1 winged helix-turn-helix transcriptional regulator [Patescibacteria group bacterium]